MPFVLAAPQSFVEPSGDTFSSSCLEWSNIETRADAAMASSSRVASLIANLVSFFSSDGFVGRSVFVVVVDECRLLLGNSTFSASLLSLRFFDSSLYMTLLRDASRERLRLWRYECNLLCNDVGPAVQVFILQYAFRSSCQSICEMETLTSATESSRSRQVC